MLDVFTLVVNVVTTQDASGVDTHTAETVNLLQDWPTVDLQDVLKSNKYYNTHTSDSVLPWVRQNLEMSHKFILDSCDEDLQAQLTDLISQKPPAEHGGPLTFKLLMDLLQINSERAITHLLQCVRKLDVKDFDGENIVEVVAQVRGAHKRLLMVTLKGKQSAVPATFTEDVMDVMQTSSTEEFNSAFNYQRLRVSTKLISSASPLTMNPTLEEVLDAAVQTYKELLPVGKWLGVDNKAKETAFAAQINPKDGKGAAKPQSICWNCGQSGHNFPQCKAPKNEANIKKNRDAFNANKGSRRHNQRGGRGGGSGNPRNNNSDSQPTVSNREKWKPPQPWENNKRFITVKKGTIPHTWNPANKRWVADVAVAGPPSTPTTIITPAGCHSCSQYCFHSWLCCLCLWHPRGESLPESQSC